MDSNIYNTDGLYHWGVRGMRWGIRRYQNKDGSLTPAGKKRYNAELEKVRERETACPETFDRYRTYLSDANALITMFLTFSITFS